MRLRLIALLLCSVFCFPSAVAQQPPAKKAPLTTEQLEQELDAAATALLALLDKGEPAELPTLCSADGVLFGSDKEATALEDLRADIERKQGAYCLLFSTDCLRQQEEARRTKAGLPARPSEPPAYSLRERLRKATKREADLAVNRVEDTWVGDVFVHLEGAVGIATGRQPVELSFAYEEGRWRLIAIASR